MAFKRYDGVYSRALQEKFDNEMAVCPFCGGSPHWLLDLKSGFTKGTVTCMCEKCGAKLYTESTVAGWNDDLRVTDVGSSNINGLELNGTYNIKALGNIAPKTAASGEGSAEPSAPEGGADELAEAVAQSAPAQAPAAEAAQAAPTKPFYKNKWVWLAAAAFVITVALVAILIGTYGCQAAGNNKKKAFAEDAARQIIAETLKAPSSAVWNEVSYMENNDDGLYIIYVDVSAQNSFGVYLRSKYFVIVKDIDLDKQTFNYNRLFYCIECSGKDDTYNLELIKSVNQYNGAPDAG